MEKEKSFWNLEKELAGQKKLNSVAKTIFAILLVIDIGLIGDSVADIIRSNKKPPKEKSLIVIEPSLKLDNIE